MRSNLAQSGLSSGGAASLQPEMREKRATSHSTNWGKRAAGLSSVYLDSSNEAQDRDNAMYLNGKGKVCLSGVDHRLTSSTLKPQFIVSD